MFNNYICYQPLIPNSRNVQPWLNNLNIILLSHTLADMPLQIEYASDAVDSGVFSGAGTLSSRMFFRRFMIHCLYQIYWDKFSCISTLYNSWKINSRVMFCFCCTDHNHCCVTASASTLLSGNATFTSKMLRDVAQC